MPRPGLQRKRATAALSQAGRAGPDQPIRASPASRPVCVYAADVIRLIDVRDGMGSIIAKIVMEALFATCAILTVWHTVA